VEYREYMVSVFLFSMFTFLPLLVKKGFIYIASYKLSLFRWISLVFLAVSAVFLCIEIIFTVREKKKIFNFSNISLADWFIIAYGLWNVVSYLFSGYRGYAFLGYDGWEMGLLTQGLMIFGYFLVSRWYNGNKYIWYVAAAVLVIESVLVILNRTGNDPLSFYKDIDWFDWNHRNLLGTIGNINWLCGYMICILPILMALYIYSEKMYLRIILGISLYLSLAALMLQGSRSGLVALAALFCIMVFLFSDTWNHLARVLEMMFMICLFWSLMSVLRVDLIEPFDRDIIGRVYTPLWLIPTGVFAALLIAIFLMVKKHQKSAAKKTKQDILQSIGTVPIKGIVRKIILAVPIFLIAMGIVILVICQFSDSFWALFGSPSILRFNERWGSLRGFVWKETFAAFAHSGVKNWITGVGPDCFAYWFIDSGIDIPTEGFYQGAAYSNAHNEWLTALVNTGLIGLVAYIGIFAGAIRSYIKNTERSKEAAIGILVLTAYLSNQFFSFQQVLVTPFLFLIMGMCENRMRILRKETTESIGK